MIRIIWFLESYFKKIRTGMFPMRRIGSVRSGLGPGIRNAVSSRTRGQVRDRSRRPLGFPQKPFRISGTGGARNPAVFL